MFEWMFIFFLAWWINDTTGELRETRKELKQLKQDIKHGKV